METSSRFPEEVRRDLLRRLRLIEGQAQGVQRMLEEGRRCDAILEQLKSIRAAAHSASIALMRYYARECLKHSAGTPLSDRTIEEIVDLILRVPS